MKKNPLKVSLNSAKLPQQSAGSDGGTFPGAVPQVLIIEYDRETYREEVLTNIDDCAKFKNTPETTWINITGIDHPEKVEKIGDIFDIHRLTVEDIISAHQRPKTEEYENYVFTVVKILNFDRITYNVEVEQVSIVAFRNKLLTFSEKNREIFLPVIKRIQETGGRNRGLGPDYLTYSLLDTIVDNYYDLMEQIEEEMENLELGVLEDSPVMPIKRIHRLKSALMQIRRQVQPLRESIRIISDERTPFFQETTLLFLRDLLDHLMHILETIDIYRDTLNGLIDISLSAASNRMNNIMKVLTIITTIFIPLSFIAGLYGMNFHFMPELSWKWGYYFVLGVMAAAAAVMLWLFKKKKWL